MDVIELID